MSKSNARQRYFQLTEWLESRKKFGNTTKPAKAKNFSKADHYKSKGVR